MKPSLFAGLAVAAALAACSTPVTRYYTLAEPGASSAAPRSAAPLFIELAPLAVPERLARPQMVVRKADAASTPSDERPASIATLWIACSTPSLSFIGSLPNHG